MSVKEKMVLCISGYDPSGGAGMLADIKTCEATGSYGMGVLTSNTIQTENQFIANHWINKGIIKAQLETLLNSYKFKAVKIGIIEDLTFLETIINHLIKRYKDVNIIWDPVLKATAGHSFHSEINNEILYSILSKITLITPNIPEFNHLFKDALPLKISEKYCSVLLKGGHENNNEQIIDKLFVNGKENYFSGKRCLHSKHGTGCILSSAIASFLSKGFNLYDACKKAKHYISQYLESDTSLLGKHILNYENN